MGKVFQTKTAQNLTQWGGTYLYGLYKGVPPESSYSEEAEPLFEAKKFKERNHYCFSWAKNSK